MLALTPLILQPRVSINHHAFQGAMARVRAAVARVRAVLAGCAQGAGREGNGGESEENALEGLLECGRVIELAVLAEPQ